MIAHMTAHFRGGPLDGQSRYNSCEKSHGHTIAVQDVLALPADPIGFYQVDGEPISAEVMGEFLIDVVYNWFEADG